MFPKGASTGQGIRYASYIDSETGEVSKCWEITGLGNYCSSGYLVNNSWWPLTNDTAYFYFEDAQEAIPAEYKGINNQQKKYPLAFYWANNEGLINLPINYSAGLMKYFYDQVNVPPYLKKVTLTQNNATVYEAEWVDSGGGRVLTPTVNKPVELGAQLGIELEFNKRMKNVSLDLKHTVSYAEVKGGALDLAGLKWTAYVSGPEVINIDEGLQALQITAADATGKTLDTNPATVARRDSNGELLGYEHADAPAIEGRDTRHNVTFRGTPPVVDIFAGKQVCSGASGIKEGKFFGYTNPSYSSPYNQLDVRDSTSGVKSVLLTGPDGELINTTFDVPVSTNQWLWTSLKPGNYALTVKDAVDNETSLNFSIAALDVLLDTSALSGVPVSVNGWPRIASAKFGVKINAGAGLRSVELRGPSGDVALPVETTLQYAAKSGETTFETVYDANFPIGGMYKVIAQDLDGNARTLNVRLSAAGGGIYNSCQNQLTCTSPIHDMWKLMLYQNEVPGELPPNLGIMPGAAILAAAPSMTWIYSVIPTPLVVGSPHDMGYVDISVQSWDPGDSGGGTGGALPRVNYYEVAGENQCPADALYSFNDCNGQFGCVTPVFSRCGVINDPVINIPISRFATFTHTAVNSNQTSLPLGMCPAPCFNTHDNTCSCSQALEVLGSVLNASAFGVQYVTGSEDGLMIRPGANVAVAAATGLEIVYDFVTEPGGGAASGSRVFEAAPDGYNLLAGYEISNSVPFSGMATLKFAYDPAAVSPAQAALAQVYRVVTNGTEKVYEKIVTTFDPAAKQIIGQTGGFSTYIAVYPVLTDPVLVTNGQTPSGSPEFSILTERTPTAQALPSGATQVSAPVRTLLAAGLAPVGKIYSVTDSTGAYRLYGLVSIAYDENEITSQNIPESSLSLYAFDAAGNAERLDNLNPNFAANTITGRVYTPKQYYAVLAATTPVPLPAVDDQPPVTMATHVTAAYKPNQYIVYTSATVSIALDAYDMPADTSAAVGVYATYYKVDPDSTTLAAGLNGETTQYYSVYSSTLSLEFQEGRHLLTYGSIDNKGLYEPLEAESIYVDLTAPISRFRVDGGSKAIGGITYASASSLFSLQAEDALSNGVASGVQRIHYLVDKTMQDCLSPPTFSGPPGTCENPVYSSPFTLAGGTHAIYFLSEDNTGNLENYKVENVTVVPMLDVTAPTTYLEFQSRAYIDPSGDLYLNSRASVAVSAVDPPVDGFASGVATTYYLVDADVSVSTPMIYFQEFTLAEGTHTIWYTSVDNWGNYDVPRSSFVLVDATPPVAELSIGSSVLETGATGYITTAEFVTLTAMDPVSNSLSSGREHIFFLVDRSPETCRNEPDFIGPAGTCHNPRYTEPFSLPVGTHTVYYSAGDNVGNKAPIKTAQLTVAASQDTTPPVTDIAFSAPNFGTELVYISSLTEINLSAYDDTAVAGDRRGSVAAVYYSVDSDTFSVYSGSFSITAEGGHVVKYYSEDTSGNIETVKISSVTVDNTAPVTAFEVTGSSLVIYGNIYVVSGSSLTLAASDALSGAKKIYYSLDGTTDAAVSPLSLSVVAGEHTLAFYSMDNVGNAEIEKSVIFFVDSEAPVTTASVSDLTGANGWHVSPVSLTLASTDAMSGVETVFYNLERVVSESEIVLLSSGAYTESLPVSDEGIYAYSYYSTDKAGNIEPKKDGSFKIDISSPEIVALSTPAANAYGWNNSTVAAVFSGTDSVSGIAFCTPDILVEFEGSNMTMGGHCSNNAGLTSMASVTVNIDTTAPVVTYERIPAANLAGWNNSDVTVKFTCVDPLSGMASCPADIALSLVDGVNISTSAIAYDLAGNSVETAVSGINIDRGLPVSTASVSGTPKNGYYGAPVAVTILSTDTVSGVAETFYSLDGGDIAEYQSPVEVSAEGHHTVLYYAQDKAGNQEADQTLKFSIDVTAPVSAAALAGPYSNGLYISSVTVTISWEDALSGILETRYSLDNDAFQIYLSSFAIQENGPHTVSFYSTDKAGNTEATKTVAFTIQKPLVDSAPPVTDLQMAGTYYTEGVKHFISPSGSYIRLTSTDSLSGVKTVYYTVDPSPEILASGLNSQTAALFAVYSGTFSLQEGKRTVAYGALDMAGNYEELKTAVIYADGTPPESSFEVLGSSDSDALGNLVITLGSLTKLVADDPVVNETASGVKQIMFNVDGGVSSVYNVSEPILLNQGFHKLEYYAEDNVFNRETKRTLEVFVGEMPNTAIWSGLAGDGNWYNPGNWRNNAVPGPDDNAVVATRDTVFVSSTSPVLTVRNLVLGDAEGVSVPIMVISTGVISSGKWTINKNAILTQNTLEPFKINELLLLAGGRMEHTANGSEKKSIINLHITGDLTIMAGSAISVTGAGYAGGYGPGAPIKMTGYEACGGGGYGGTGGGDTSVYGIGIISHREYYAGLTYGSVKDPINLGSGGACSYSSGYYKASGGGAVLIKVDGRMVTNGLIAADGETPPANTWDILGGSGGSINIEAAILDGNGVVEANGSKSTFKSFYLPGGTAAGGGGRIAVKARSEDSSNLNISANAGLGLYYWDTAAGAGTIYRETPDGTTKLMISQSVPMTMGANGHTLLSTSNMDSSFISLRDMALNNSRVRFEGVDKLKIDGQALFTGVNFLDYSNSEGVFGGGVLLPANNEMVIATMTLPASANLTLTGATLRVFSLMALGSVTLESADGWIGSVLEQTGVSQWTIGSLIVKGGSKVTHKANGSLKQYAVNMKVLGDMTVESGGSVDVSGLGYGGGVSGQNGNGPGFGYGDTTNGAGGAGYGDSGGRGHGGTLGGISYGSIGEPEDLGSGGGGSNGVVGGAGGGAIGLVVGGTLTVNGSLLAKGYAGGSNTSYGGGGGSGGSINIRAGGFSGTGTLNANGGAGGAGSMRGGGGGAGGRISGAVAFGGEVGISGGNKGSNGALNGSNGTFYDQALIAPAAVDVSLYDVFITSLSVRWDPAGNSDGTKYYIELSDISDYSGAKISSITDKTDMVFNDLSPNTLYYARVAATSRGYVTTPFSDLGSGRTQQRPGERWVGAAVGDWHDPSNWDNGGVPVSTDPVIIDGNVTVITYSTNPPVEFASLTLGKEDGSATASLVISTGVYSGNGMVTLNPSSMLTQATLEPIRLNSMTMKNGSKLNHKANLSTKEYIVNLDISGDFIMATGSMISVTGAGYAGKYGPGTPNPNYDGGGAYGGTGGGSVSVGLPYGSAKDPVDLGSGGNTRYSMYKAAGGGAVLVTAGGRMVMDGLIAADGEPPSAGRQNIMGGSGGSINIEAAVLEGRGVVNANGSDSTYPAVSWVTGGGGGRIAVKTRSGDSSSLNMSARAGTEVGRDDRYGGEAGTIYREMPGGITTLTISQKASQLAPSCPGYTLISSSTMGTSFINLSSMTLNNARVRFEGVEKFKIDGQALFTGFNFIEDSKGEGGFDRGVSLPLYNEIALATMTLPASANLTLSGATLRVSSFTALGSVILDGASILEQTGTSQWTIGSLIVKSGSKVTHKANGSLKQYAVNMKVLGNMTVESGGSVDVSGRGYTGGASGHNGNGPGFGYGDASNGGGGGGYGGLGGMGYGGTLGGISYGSVAEPEDLGSGGGGSNGVAGGAGGGAINLVVIGTLTVNGALTANGMVGATNGSYGGGGGSGGTIRLAAGKLAGLGRIDVSGGVGGSGSIRSGGGAAGGRVSGVDLFAGTKSVAGGSGWVPGQNGTWHDSGVVMPGVAEPAFTEVTPSGFTVNWTGIPETKYWVEVSRQFDFSAGIISSAAYGTSAEFTDLTGNATYYVRAAVMNNGMIATEFISLGSTRTLKNFGETWIGPNNGDWNDPANWDNGAIPVSTDPITINESVTVVTYSTNSAISFASLTLGNPGGTKSSALKLSTGTLSAGSITIYPGALLTQNTTEQVVISTLTMHTGSLLNHTNNTTTRSYVVNLRVMGEFIMEAGSTVNVRGLGYTSRKGPGVGNYFCGAGSGYGGSGGGMSGCIAGRSYGSLINPVEPGSGGYNTAGGGVFIIDAGATVLNGYIDASGNNSSSSAGSSGGSINIRAVNLSGNGILQADGGSAYDGGGGGGRITIIVSGTDTSNLALSADGGSSSRSPGGAGTIYMSNPMGSRLVISRTSVNWTGNKNTTDISSSTIEATTLSLNSIVFNNAETRFLGIERINILNTAQFSGRNSIEYPTGEGNFPGGGVLLPGSNEISIATMTFPSVSTLTLAGATLRVSSLTALGSVILDNASLLEQTGTSQWTIGSLIIKSGSKVTHKANGAQRQYAVNMKVLGDLTVESGGSVDVSGLGYGGGASKQNGKGPGFGYGDASNGGGGAGYGGTGGRGHGGTLGGVSYGSISDPEDLGSGGGGGNGVIGGVGGGAINLLVGGTLTVNGSLLAKGYGGGTNGSYGGGGGAGGSINIRSAVLKGTGTFDASGGTGGAGSIRGGGGGAGGRIGLYGSFAGSTTVRGSNGGGLAQAGAYGTIGSYYVASAQTVDERPEVFVNASQAVDLVPVDVSTGVGSIILATANASGIYPVSNLYEVGPENVAFYPPLLLTFRYSTSTLAEFNISENDIYLYHYEPDGSLAKVPGQLRDTGRKEISVEISMLASIFAIFGESTDYTAPATMLRMIGPEYNTTGKTYISTRSSVALSAYDPVVHATSTGVAFTEFRVDPATSTPFTPYASPFALSAGPHIIEFRSQDNAGNPEIVKSSAVFVDGEPPTAEFSLAGTSFTVDGTLYVIPGSTMTLDSSDTASGVKALYYVINGTTYTAPAGHAEIVLSADGDYLFRYYAADNVNNAGEEKSITVRVDATPPATDITLAGTYGRNGWYISGVAGNLNWTDILSGVKQTFYSLDGSAFTVYAASFAVSAEGIHTVAAYSTDNAGNIESTKTFTFKIDISTPIAGYASEPAANAYGWNNIPVAVVFTGSDTVSGTEYCSSSFTITNEGLNIPVSGYCMDYAGWSSTVSFTVNIDTTAPLAAYERLPAANAAGWNNSDVTVNFTCTDSLSGVKSCPDGVLLAGEGMNISTAAKAEDYAGNSRDVSVSDINIDKTAPLSTAVLAGTYNNGWYSSPVSVTLTSTDALSGAEETLYSLDGAGYTAYQQAIMVSGEGNHTLRYYARDKAGNREAGNIVEFKIDTSAPLVAYVLDPAPDASGWNNTPVSVVFSDTDTLSGVVACSSQTVLSEGKAQLVAGWCRDTAGNIGYATATVNIDLTQPVVSAVQSPAANSYGWNSTPVEVLFTGSDTLSGLASCEPAKIISVEGASQAVSGYCTDYAGLSSTLTYIVNIDTTPPAILISSPAAGTKYAAADIIGIDFNISDNLSLVSSSAARLRQTADNGSPRGVLPDIIPVTAGQILAAADIDDGVWELIASATDYAGNYFYAAGGAFEVVHDTVPPVTAIVFSSVTVVEPDGRVLLPENVLVSFQASDVSGIAATRYFVDSGTAAEFAAAFALSPGAHSITYWSTDNAGNTETAKIAQVFAGKPVAVVTLDLEPDTLNLNSNGQYVTAILRMEGVNAACFSRAGVNISAINGTALAAPIYAADLQGNSDEDHGRSAPAKDKGNGKDNGKGKDDKNDGHNDKDDPGNDGEEPGGSSVQCGTMTVKFDRGAVIAVLPVNAMVKITVSGKFADGQNFSADDTIRTIKPRPTSRRDGGRFEHDKRASADAPPMALKADDELYVVSVESDISEREAKKESAAKSRGVARRGLAYEFGPDGAVFDKPVTISLPYDPDEKSPEKLVVAYWNEAAGSWEPLASRHDAQTRVVKAEVGHFSQYQLVQAAPTPSGSGNNPEVDAPAVLGADPAFKLGEVYVFPNPAKGGAKPVFHIETGIADSVEITVYTVSGRTAHQHTMTGAPEAMDDGNGMSYAYEYTWDGHIPSGVYYYSVKAEKSGRILKKAGKFAVVR